MVRSMVRVVSVLAMPAFVVGLAASPARAAFPVKPRSAGPLLQVDDMMGMPPKPMAPAAGMAAAPPGGMMGGMMGMPMPPTAMAPPGMATTGMAAPGAAKMVPEKMAAGCGMPPMPSAAGGAMAQPPGGPAMQAGDPLDHFAGRVAFLKAEIGVTDAQEADWNQFALALHTDHQHLMEARQALAEAPNPSDSLGRLSVYEQHLAMRLEALRNARAGYVRLYATLSPMQKQAADELAVPFLESL